MNFIEKPTVMMIQHVRIGEPVIWTHVKITGIPDSYYLLHRNCPGTFPTRRSLRHARVIRTTSERRDNIWRPLEVKRLCKIGRTGGQMTVMVTMMMAAHRP